MVTADVVGHIHLERHFIMLVVSNKKQKNKNLGFGRDAFLDVHSSGSKGQTVNFVTGFWGKKHGVFFSGTWS